MLSSFSSIRLYPQEADLDKTYKLRATSNKYNDTRNGHNCRTSDYFCKRSVDTGTRNMGTFVSTASQNISSTAIRSLDKIQVIPY